MVDVGWSIRLFAVKSTDNWCSHIDSFVDSDIVMYLAFVVDMVVHP